VFWNDDCKSLQNIKITTMKMRFTHTLLLALACLLLSTGIAEAQKRKSKARSKSATPQAVKSQAPMKMIESSEASPVVVENDQIIVKDPKPENELVEKVKDNGEVNWSQRFIEAKGSSVLDLTRFPNPAQARLMAQRGAMVDAQRNLLEIIQGVHVQGRTTVQDMITVSDEVKTKVDGVIKNAQMIGDAVESNGIITITMRVPLYENGVADAVIDNVERNKPNTQDAKSNLEATPIAIQVNGNYKPNLFPKLTDEQNKVLIDLAESYGLPANKLPDIFKVAKETTDKLKGKSGVEIVEVIQDQAGNLVLDTKNKARLEKWKKILTTGFKIIRTILLPI
jgi:hypothetical protein